MKNLYIDFDGVILDTITILYDKKTYIGKDKPYEEQEKYFDNITIIPCPKKISKTKMVHTRDSILVDDYSGNLREWVSEGGIGVKFSQYEESCEFPVINNLTELIDMF